MRSAFVLSLALGVIGCGTNATPPADGGNPLGTDAASPHDGDTPRRDAALDAVGSDAGTSPEVCTGGLDEDGDTAIDCADPDCFEFADCMAADVAHTTTGLVACRDPIVIDAAMSAMACATIGMPMLQTTPTDCANGSLTATAQVFCDADGHAAALWIEERITTPETQQMLDARHFRRTLYERESVLDWERQESGPGGREGGSGFPIHEYFDNAPGGGNLFRVITVRSVLGGDRISRLVGFASIDSLIDLDSGTSMDTRTNVHLGGLILTVPSP
jgi:hypothetical protein